MNKIIHVKFEYNDALDSRKDILKLEMEIVKTLKQLKSYQKERKNEFKLKNTLKRKFLELAKLMKQLEEFFPQDAIPKHAEMQEIPKQIRIKVGVDKKRMTDLEKELLNLRQQLHALQ